jgi:tetratricopeptide (TPR) repeat protein
MGDVLAVLSEVAAKRKDIEGALEFAQKALKAHGKRLSIAQAIADFVRLGKLLLEWEMPGEAAKFFRDALDVAARARGKEHPSVGEILFWAGKVALAEEDPKRALRCLQTSIEIGEKALGRLHEDLVERLSALAEAHMALSKWGAAEAAIRRIGEIHAKAHPGELDWQAITPAKLGDMCMRRKAYARAAELYEQSLALAEQAFGKDSVRLHVILDEAGEAHQKAGSMARTEELSLRLLAMLEKELGPDDTRLFPAVVRITDVYVKTGNLRAAEWVPRSMKLLKARTAEVTEETAEMNAELAKRKADLARQTGRS